MSSLLKLSNCVEKLFTTGYMSDITFYVGNSKTNSTRFPAHKCFMSLASPVFSAMLEGKFIENETGEILITDVTPLAFNVLLRFIYLDTFEARVNIVEYEDILHVSRKYMMESLTNRCLEKLADKAITIDNFWSFYNIIYNYFSEQMPPVLVINTLKFLAKNTQELLLLDECENFSHDTVSKIVESEALDIKSELTVINFILNWSRMECYRQKLDVTFDNRRKVLGDIIYKIKFLTLSRFELKNQSDLLSISERETLIPFLLKQKVDDGDDDEDNNENEDDHEDEHNDIPYPWDYYLLTIERWGSFDAIWWDSYNETHTDPPNKNYKISIISAKDFVFKFVRLNVLCDDKLFIKCRINKLNGDTLKQFNFEFKHTDIDKQSNIVLDVASCLKAFTVYIFDMEFEHGSLSGEKYDLNYHFDINGDTLFIIEEIVNCKQYEAKSLEYWQSVFKLGKQNGKRLDCYINGIGVYY